jgi:hypothetical protein
MSKLASSVIEPRQDSARHVNQSSAAARQMKTHNTHCPIFMHLQCHVSQ